MEREGPTGEALEEDTAGSEQTQSEGTSDMNNLEPVVAGGDNLEMTAEAPVYAME